MRVGSSFFGGAIFGGTFFGSPPSPSETSLVGKMCHFSSSAVWGVAEVCPLWLWPFHYPPASRLQPLYRQPRSPPCHWTKSSFLVYFPSVQISVSPGWPYFQTHSKLALQPALVCLIWIPGVSPPFSSLSQFFTSDPLLAGLMLSRCGWEGAEKLFLVWVLTDVDIAFHQPFYKQTYGSKWKGINTCQVLSYSLMGLWASGINLCRGDISATTLKSANGFLTFPRALEMN